MRSAAPRTPWFAWTAVTIAWTVVVGVGMASVAIYSHTEGTPADPPAHWPASSRLPRTVGRATLLVFVHPHCPCTRATLTEMAELLAATSSALRTQVLLYEPTTFTADWPSGGHTSTAAGIVGVETYFDPGGREAACFGAHTSGETLLYDSNGRLMFHGGITPARGHEGDSVGNAALRDALIGDNPRCATAPVFGCAIRGTNEAERAESSP